MYILMIWDVRGLFFHAEALHLGGRAKTQRQVAAYYMRHHFPIELAAITMDL